MNRIQAAQLSAGNISNALPYIPVNTITEFDSLATKDIQCAPDGQVYAACAESLDPFQIFDTFASSSIRDRLAAPLAQPLDQLLVDPALQTLVIRRVDEELRAGIFQ